MTEVKGKPLIIGVGNPMRGDDAFGIEVVSKMQTNYPDLAEYVKTDGDLSLFLELWTERDVVIVDAVQGSGKAGTIYHFEDLKSLQLKKEELRISHGIGLADALALAETLDKKPKSFQFIGTEISNYELGSLMSKDLYIIVEEIIEIIKSLFPS